MANLEQRIDDLSDAERGWLIRQLADSHPRIAKQLLDGINLNREHDAIRQSMPRHPLARHESVTGAQLCYFRSGGAFCLRGAEDPLHAVGATSGGAR
jgi:hypothetical protein